MPKGPEWKRRVFLRAASAFSTGLIISGWGSVQRVRAEKEHDVENDNEEDVSPVEDVMREHGVLRRALLVYTSSVVKLRSTPLALAPESLQTTAKLFRVFGEDYHEKMLEEMYIFPAVKRVRGSAANLPDILIAQHHRGREITDYILAVTQGAKFDTNNAEPLARVLESFVLMYRHHAAREDTIVFPIWKKTLSSKQLDEMGEKFEEIERQQFGKDGYEEAVKQISGIEESLGLANLAQFTAPSPPPSV